MRRSILLATGMLLGLAARPSAAAPSPAPAKPKPRLLACGSAAKWARLPSGAPAISAVKAQAPVRIQLLPGPVLSGGRQAVRIVVIPLVEADGMRIEVDAADGLAVAAGLETWSAAAHAGRAVSQALVVQTRGPGERSLLVSVTLQHGDQEEQAVAAYAMSPAASSPAGSRPTGARRVRRPDGRYVLEVPGEAP
jgi:hypothetical protein